MNTANNASRKNYDLRAKTGAEIIQFERAVEVTDSQRAAAELAKIPRSTAQGRIARRNERSLPVATQAFLDTCEGMMFIHRIILAVEFIISQIAGAGIRVIQLFLEHAQLDQWVASSYGSINKRVDILESNIARFGQEQERIMKADMRERDITGCLDETFPSGIFLVAIEPISNFVLLEKQADDRTSKTWKAELDKRLKDLPVNINQVTADKATALVKLAEQELDAHYSPDLFHIQQDLSKATSAPLARKVTACENVVEAVEQELKQAIQDNKDYASQPVKPVGRPVDYAGRIGETKAKLATAKLDLKEAQSWREQVRESVRALGDIYHPINLKNGAKRTPHRVEKAILNEMLEIEMHAEAANLSENSIKKIEKAKRTIDSMQNTIEYFWTTTAMIMSSLNQNKEQKHIFERYLLPIIYINLQIPKARDAEHKKELKKSSSELQAQIDANTTWRSMEKHDRGLYEEKALECAHTFQRSTSNVEGRNGYLSLHHHSFRQMNERKLQAATVVHNYFIKRPDGTTAAERFFEQSHEDLFEWLLQETDFPAQPRTWASKRRKKVANG